MNFRDEPRPTELTDLDADQIIDLDVREDLRAGREPFRRIMSARADRGPDQVIRLRAIFEPIPLYKVMAEAGLSHWTVRKAEDDWEVWFFAENSSGASSGSEGSTPSVTRSTDAFVHTLDVRGFGPPEPMVRTLEALADLPAGDELLQINTRVPQFLLPELESRGFAYEVQEVDAETVHVRIRHADL